MEILEGTIENIVFRNDDNGYSVIEIDADGSLETATGVLPPVGEGERVRLFGEWIDHKTYGSQFNAAQCEQLPPDTKEGIIRYLASGIVKGVGPKTAQRIVDAFRERTLDVIRDNPERLEDVEGIGRSKAKIIAAALSEHIQMQDNMVLLQSLQVPVALAARICNQYGAKTQAIVENYPYQMAAEVEGIGFLRADKIARQMGFNVDSQERLVAGIAFTLGEAARIDGHTCLPVATVAEKSAHILSCSADLMGDAIMKAIVNRDVVLREYGGIEYLYLPAYDLAERETGTRLMELANQDLPSIGIQIDEAADILMDMRGIVLSNQQKQAVETAMTSGVSVITGGPGTGKTTTINSLIWALEQVGTKILLGAPTGRAAKRMSEATGHEARTIHRILEYGYSEDEMFLSFNKDNENQLECDALIVDEVSMVDIILMQHLLRAVPNGCRLILVGDADQLPSVGAGYVLGDIIDSGLVKVARLTEIFRQAQASMIVTNAHKINNGQLPVLNDRKNDFFFVKKARPEDVLHTVITMAGERIPNYLNCDPLRDIQVLSPVKKGDLGVFNLNTQLQHVFNPDGKGRADKVFGSTTYRVGDKVMQIKNNYKIKFRKRMLNGAYYDGEGVFNGDTGYITDINLADQTVTVEFDDQKIVEYTYKEMDEVALAYAVTIHKSQGSEYDVVILPLLSGPSILMTRNLLYTAVTRAKKMVVIIGDENKVYQMCKNDMMVRRHTCLKYTMETHL